MNWHLEDAHGQLHVAYFVPVKTNADLASMRWDKRIHWNRELIYAKKDGRLVHKLIDASGMVHGGISLSEAGDHVYIHLIESATHNRTDPRVYVNVARLLIAFAGLRSFHIGADGFLALMSKTSLYDYYLHRYRAFPLPGGKVGIDGSVTNGLISVYYR
jgi:hypothetical protein